ncbi:hypothetical protein EDO6_00072 [Paenibacillus xylanexedens]|nr:hypothetical protein EDO6_00072 [Paenibacillus xylanexedens]
MGLFPEGVGIWRFNTVIEVVGWLMVIRTVVRYTSFSFLAMIVVIQGDCILSVFYIF